MVHEWGASILMSFVAEISGDNGLGYALFKLLIAGCLFGFIYYLGKIKSTSKEIALFVATVISIFLSFRLTLRAENLAFILFALYMYLFYLFIQQQKKVFLIPIFLVIIFWVNIHGSFALAFVVLFIYLATIFVMKPRHKNISAETNYFNTFLLLIVISLASMINPYGLEIFQKAFAITTSEYMKKFVAEWQPTFSPDFALTPSFYFYISYFVFTLTLMILFFKKNSLFDKFIYLFFAALSFLALRHVAYFYIATAASLSYNLSLLSKKSRQRFLMGMVALFTLSLIYVINFGNYVQFKMGTRFEAPLDIETIKWLRKENYRGPVFNSYILGDQLIYNFYSNMEVVVDSRTDLYGEDFMKRYINTLSDNKAFSLFLEKNNIQLIVLDNPDFNHYFFANKDRLAYLDNAGWRLGFRTDQNIVLRRMTK